MSENITLYLDSNYVSPYTFSVFIALTEKGLPFGIKEWNLDTKENRNPDYQKKSLSSRVPGLTHGNFNLAESSAIEEYLEEQFAPPKYTSLFPRDVQQRARARQIQAWLRSDFLPLRNERPTEVIFFAPVKTPLGADAELSAERLLTAADSLIAPGATSLFGEWCIADSEFALMLNRLVINGDPVPEKIAAFARHQWKRPSVQAWLARVPKK